MKPRSLIFAGLFLLALPVIPMTARAQQQATQVSQYGLTWSFDRPHTIGRFVNGDYWVLGPVRIVAVTPAPGPAGEGENATSVKSRYGATGMQPDTTLRNGSMIVRQPDKRQGYDSRLKNFDARLAQRFPLELGVNESLISTISGDGMRAPVLLDKLMWPSEQAAVVALESAAILTCLDKTPPPDAFRPPYAGAAKPIFLARNIRWELLPRLAPPPDTPAFEDFARYFQRPWLDHIATWLFQLTGPRQNQPNYGREIARATSMASLMLMLDVPLERKQELMIGLIQFGIDTHGLLLAGRNWTADGGHWNGRKWPVLFAGLMLGETAMQRLPGNALFSEDQQTYHGQGWAGQTALFQMVYHTGRVAPYEEKPPGDWNAADRKSELYRQVVSKGLAGTALAAELMGAKALWDHEAFFDYYDRWMATDDAYAANRGGHPRPKGEGNSQDAFVDAMWAAYRSQVPSQPSGHTHRRWLWGDSQSDGQFIDSSPTVQKRQTTQDEHTGSAP